MTKKKNHKRVQSKKEAPQKNTDMQPASDTKPKQVATKLRLVKKATANKVSTGGASLNRTALTTQTLYRAICLSEDKRLARGRKMSETEAKQAAEAHRLETGHAVNVEPC